MELSLNSDSKHFKLFFDVHYFRKWYKYFMYISVTMIHVSSVICYTHTYQTKSLKTSRYPVPGCNEKPGRREVICRWKYVLKLVSNSLYQGNIGCLPVEKVSTPTQVKVFPVRSNQWRTEKWECASERAGEWRSEGEESIGVHLHLIVRLLITIIQKQQQQLQK